MYFNYMFYYPLILAGLLSLLNFYSEVFAKIMKKHNIPILSFSSGILITFIFLQMFPEIENGLGFLGDKIYFAIFAGFVLFHLTERYVYQHIKDKKKLMENLSELHIFGFFIEHFILGLTLVVVFSLPNIGGSLIFLPLALLTISSSISLEHIHSFSRNSISKFLLSISIFVGAFIATFARMEDVLFYYLFGFLIGSLLYIVVRDMMPKGERGNVKFFILGILIMVMLMSMAGVL